MNRRAFFGLIAAAIGLPHVVKRRYWRIVWSKPIYFGEVWPVAHVRPPSERAAILKLKEELSKKIKEANRELKQINKRMQRDREKLADVADAFGKASQRAREFADAG